MNTTVLRCNMYNIDENCIIFCIKSIVIDMSVLKFYVI